MENYRTFVAVPLKVPKLILRDREELIHSLSGDRISWVDPGLYHITIRFIGDTPPSLVRQIGNSLKELVNLPEKATLSLNGPGSFGPRLRPRVVWAGFEDPGIFHLLRRSVDEILSAYHMQLSGQTYNPHLTLGRVRRLNDPEEFHAVIERMGDRFKGKVQVNSLVYYRSELGGGSPVYTPLEQLVLPA